jgi:M6 family metalloprotease-like protein
MPRQALATLILAGVLASGAGRLFPVASAAASLPSAASGEVPRPCFVPPHPFKQGVAPRPESPSSPRAGQIALEVGGAFEPYHDGHLREGIAGGAEDLTPRRWRIAAVLVDFEEQPMGAGFAAAREDSIRLYFDRALTHLDQMYRSMSDGLQELTWDLSPSVYRMPRSMAYYGLDDSIATREADLCRDAVEAADADIDFGDYDVYMVFHAGPGQEADILNDSQDQIWSVFFRQVDFGYWLNAPDAERGIRTTDLTATGDTVFVTHTVVLPETESQDGYEFGLLGVVAHEFGHRFGLPDLYDTTGPADFIYADSQGIGTFGLMGAGIWNDNGFFPAEMEAWSKFYIGWLRPRVIRPEAGGGEQIVSLEAIQLARREGAVRIPMGGDEYLLIENRARDYNYNGIVDFTDADDDSVFDFWTDGYGSTADGGDTEFDWYLPQPLDRPRNPKKDGSGLLIWHVDESTISDLLLYNMVNADALHKGVDLEEADGIQDLDKLVFQFEAFGDARDSYWAGNATELTPESTPPSDAYSDAHTGIWITDISEAGRTMSFRLRFTSPDGDAEGDFVDGWPRDLPGLARDFQPVTGDLNGDGRLEIVLAATDENGIGGPIVLNPDGTSFLPAGGAPRYFTTGRLHAEPILVNLDGTAGEPGLEMVWVSGDTVYAARGDGSFLTMGGAVSPTPAPFFVLSMEPGRTHLVADDIDGFDGHRPEVVLGIPSPLRLSATDLIAISHNPGQGTRLRMKATLLGEAGLHSTLADLDTVDAGLKEVVTSVRRPFGGWLSVTLLGEDFDEAGMYPVCSLVYSLGDTVAFTEPVTGDLNGDGIDEIVVADSRGYVHALTVRSVTIDGISKLCESRSSSGDAEGEENDNDLFSELPGWPIEVGSLADDELSLADFDGDGELEVLIFGPVNRLYAINYNGTFDISYPVQLPGEDRFTASFLSPLLFELPGLPSSERFFALPLPDGQVRLHEPGERPHRDVSYLGGGTQRSYPVLAAFDPQEGRGLLTVEDVNVGFPPMIDLGDASPGITKAGRAILRSVGSGPFVPGGWSVYRHDTARTGRALDPSSPGQEPANGLLADTFVMPNPAAGTEPAFHYLVRSDVKSVTIEVHDLNGRLVRTIDGSVDVHTDNLVRWDLRNDHGHEVAPGLYVARLRAETSSKAGSRVVTFVVLR